MANTPAKLASVHVPLRATDFWVKLCDDEDEDPPPRPMSFLRTSRRISALSVTKAESE